MLSLLEQIGSTRQRANDLSHAFSLINTEHLIYLLCRVIGASDEKATRELYGELYKYFHVYHSDRRANGIAAAIVLELFSPKHCKKCHGQGLVKELNRVINKQHDIKCSKCDGRGWRWRNNGEYANASGIARSTWIDNGYSELIQFWVKTFEALAMSETAKLYRAMK